MGVLGEKPPASNKRAGCGGGWCLFGSVASVAVGVFFLLVGIWGTHLYARFTPVYRDIECFLESPEVMRVWFDGPWFRGMHIKVTSVTTCTNPNSYSVKIRSSKSGGIYMGRRRSPVGNLTRIPEVTLEAGGTGTIKADLLISPTAHVLGSTFALALGAQIPIYLKNNLDVDIDAKLLIGDIKASRSISKDCGMNLRMTGFLRAGVGAMSCADAWDDLVLANVTRASSHSGRAKLDFSAHRMGDDDIEEAERVKTKALAAMMSVGYGTGLVCLLAGALCCVRYRRQKRRAAGEVTPTVAVGVPLPPPQEAFGKVVAPPEGPATQV